MIDETNLKRNYVVNNNVVEPSVIPEGGDYLCVYTNENDEAVFVELYRGGELSSIDCAVCTDESMLAETAVHIARLSQSFGAVFPLVDPIKLDIAVSGADFNLDLEQPENAVTHFKARFSVLQCGSDPEQLEVTADTEPFYLAEVMLEEPAGIVLQRAMLSPSRELMGFEYPFYMLNDAGQLDIGTTLAEVTPKYEMELVSCADEEALDSLQKGSLYFLPANREDLLEAVSHRIERNLVAMLSDQGEPISEDEVHQHETVHRVTLDDANQTKVVDTIRRGQLIESTIYNIPLDEHWSVFHAYARQLHRELTLLASRHEGPRYIHVFSPFIEDSTDEVAIAEGESRQHRTTFMLDGTLISHDCFVFDESQKPVRQHMMFSPTCLKVVHTYE